MKFVISRMAVLQRRADFAVAEARGYAEMHGLSFTMPLQEGEEVVNMLPKEEAPLWQDSTNESDEEWWESSEWDSSDESDWDSSEDEEDTSGWAESNC